MKPAPTIKKFSWVLIFFDWFVYCKSDLNRQRETRSTTTGRFFTARHIRFTSTSGRQGAAPILDRKKEGIASSRFPQNAGVTTTGTIYHMAASYGGQTAPGFRRSASNAVFMFQFPGSQWENWTRSGTMMEAQPSKKMRLSQHLCLIFERGAASKRAGMKCTHGYLSCSERRNLSCQN